MSTVCTNVQCDYCRRSVLINDPVQQFCLSCGYRLEPARPAISQSYPVSVSRGRRVAAYLIDAIVGVILEAIASTPGLGSLVTILLALFWLFRDVNGASPGKTILGLVVENRNGGPSTVNQRILRNLPFAIVILPLVIPFLGIVVAYTIQFFLVLTEAILVLSTGDRLGDRFAGTRVARRSAVPKYYSQAAS